MRTARIMLPLMTALMAMTVLMMILPANAEPQAITSGWINEYPIPTAVNSEPRSIVVESPGRVWFTMPLSNAIGSLVVTSTTDYQFSFYSSPTPDSGPYDLAYDQSRGLIWFTERTGSRIGRLELATGNVTDFLITTTEKVTPTGIAVAPNGHVWFAEHGGNRLGRFDPGSQQFTEFPYPEAGADLEDVAVADNNSIWLTAPGVEIDPLTGKGPQVARFTPATGQFKRIPVNELSVGLFPPGDIVIDDRKLPWVTAPTMDQLGPFLEGTLAIWRWADTPTVGGQPTGIALTVDNEIERAWFVETEAGRVGQLLYVNSRLRRAWDTPLPTADSRPRGIAVDANGHAWITEMGANKIAEWRPPYFYFNYLPLTLRP